MFNRLFSHLNKIGTIKIIKVLITHHFLCHIYLNKRFGRLLSFRTFRMGVYSSLALIREWVLIEFLPFSATNFQ